MKLQPKFRIGIAIAMLIMAILACGPNVVQPVPTQVPQAQPTPVAQNPGSPSNGQPTSTASLIKSTVQIYGLQKQNGKLTPIYSGSGTIISATGLILTNAHVASPASQGDTSSEPDALAIGLMNKEDQPPVFLYFAKVKAVDGYLDLAVIQITTTLDGADVNTSSLNLPYVPVGDSDQLHVGDNIKIFGFPGIGGSTITFTTGNVSGFTSEQGLGDRAWIKTDATIAGGNSGGLAANDAGYLIGVPTSASAGTGGNVTDCRVVQDTNGDGVVDSKDSCIPIGGFINGLRPVNLALPLIKAAQMGQAYVTPFGGPSQTTSSGSGSESFGAITWYTADSNCKVQDPVSAFPSGTGAMAAAFGFNGMTDGEPWAEKWTVNGQVLYDTTPSNKVETWGLGSQGNSYACLFNNTSGMPEGNYHIELYAGQNLSLMTQSDVVVGGGSAPNPPSSQGVVTISGQVVDADTMNPLPGAQIFVLNPGITLSQWKTDGFVDADIFTYTKTDDNGNFLLPNKLALNVGYTIVIFADGYKITFGDNQVFTSQDPVDYKMKIKLSK